jgi:hypothetical protein
MQRRIGTCGSGLQVAVTDEQGERDRLKEGKRKRGRRRSVFLLALFSRAYSCACSHEFDDVMAFLAEARELTDCRR